MRVSTAIGILVAAAAAFAAHGSAPAPSVKYLYGLANFDGNLPESASRVRVDGPRDEAYLVQGNRVRVFSHSGMEVHSFSLDPELGSFFDVAVAGSGDMYALGMPPRREDGSAAFFVERLDYRGEPVETIVPRGVPEHLFHVVPNHLLLRDSKLYLLASMQLSLMVLRLDGTVEKTVDLAPVLGIEEKERGTVEIGGFAFDPAGGMLFTVPLHFQVVHVAADGTASAFGEVGSAPGDFGVLGSVAADGAGNIYVADKLRSVVMVFDPRHEFVSEFGGYGEAPENLVRPEHLAFSPSGKLFISQMKRRGISVFDVHQVQ